MNNGVSMLLKGSGDDEKFGGAAGEGTGHGAHDHRRARKSAALAARLIEESCLKQAIQPQVLTLHSDRGSPMTAKCTAQLLADLATITTKYQFPNAFNTVGVTFLCPDGLCDGIARDINATTGMGGNFNGVTAMPHWQGNLPIVWNVNGAHSLRFTANYRDSLNAKFRDLGAADAAVFTHEEGRWTANVNYTWLFGAGASLAFAVQNLFQTDPPEAEGTRFNRRQREYGLQFRYSLEN